MVLTKYKVMLLPTELRILPKLFFIAAYQTTLVRIKLKNGSTIISQNIEAFVLLNKLCRDGAKSYSEIKKALFGDSANAEKALDALLAIGFSCSKEWKYSIPSTASYVFAWACKVFMHVLIPNAPVRSIPKAKSFLLGKVISIPKDKCECGGRIYELVNHIKCGALYLKVYIQKNDGQPYWYVFPATWLER